MAGNYASNTEVPVDRTRAEIERTASKYGATQFMYGWDDRRAVLAFVLGGRHVRFILPLPDPQDPAFRRTPTGRSRAATAARGEYEQAVRTRWRALSLVLKAKLEAVATGIVTFEDEFLAHLVLPDGSTVGDSVAPRLHAALDGAGPAELLPPYPNELGS